MNALAQSCAAGRAHRSVSRLSAVASPGWSGVPAKSLSPRCVLAHPWRSLRFVPISTVSRGDPASRAATSSARFQRNYECVSVPLRWGSTTGSTEAGTAHDSHGHTEPSATNGSVSGPGVVGPPPRAVLGRTVSPCRRRRLVAFRIGDDRSLLRTTPSDRRFRPPIPAHARRRTACIAPARGRDRAGGRGAPSTGAPGGDATPGAFGGPYDILASVPHTGRPDYCNETILGPIRVLGSASHTVSARADRSNHRGWD